MNIDPQAYVISATVIIGFAVNAYISWKTGVNKAQASATNTWKSVADGYENRLRQVELEVVGFKKEIKELQAENNKLIGRNEELRNVQPSKLFEETVTTILNEIKTMRQDFVKHSIEDDERFKQLGIISLENNELIKNLSTR